MRALLHRLNVVIDERDFRAELARLLQRRGFDENDAADGVELILTAVRRTPVESGLKTSPPATN